MITAALEVVDRSGRLSAGDREALARNIAAALEETGRFRVPAPPSGNEARLFLLEAGYGEGSIRGVSGWDLSLKLLEPGTRKVLQEHGCFYAEGIFEPSAPLLKELAYYYAAKDDYPELVRKIGFMGSVAKHPDIERRDPQFLSTVILADLSNGAWDKALEHAGTLLEVRPQDGLGLHARALALYRLGRLEEARAAAESALAAGPKSVDWTLRGSIASDSGDYAEAERSYEEALRLEPGERQAKAKLKALRSYLDRSGPARLFTRTGWRTGYLGVFGSLVSGLPREIAEELARVTAALHMELAELSGEGLELGVEAEAANEWLRSLKELDAAAFKSSFEPLCRGVRRAAAQNFPAPAARWFDWGHQLAWIQALLHHAVETRAPDSSRAEELYSMAAAEMGGDAEYRERHAALAPSLDGMLQAARLPAGQAKVRAADDAIEAFRIALFA